jgi:hypothetical protein
MSSSVSAVQAAEDPLRWDAILVENPESSLRSLSAPSLPSLSVCCVLPSAPTRELLFPAPLWCALWLFVKLESAPQYCGVLLSVGTPSCHVWRKGLRQVKHSEIRAQCMII